MTTTIYKFVIPIEQLNEQSWVIKQIPGDMQPLYATAQRQYSQRAAPMEQVVVYFHGDPQGRGPGGNTFGLFRIYVYGTGHPTYLHPDARSLGLATMADGQLMLHVFVDQSLTGEEVQKFYGNE